MNRVVTFGCRLNGYESDLIRARLGETGRRETVVVNTCAVTGEAERQARQAIRRARREHPGARLVATGCAVQIAPESWAAMAEVDQVVGNAEKLDAATWRNPGTERVRVGDIRRASDRVARPLGHVQSRTRAFVQVQSGCDHSCTFCIIPAGRGAARSVPADRVVADSRRLVDAGCREIVLTGVDITSWGADLPGRPGLGDLVRRILGQVPDLPRLRLTSLDVAEVDDALCRAVAEEERLMPHLHLSLQAGDEMILKRMKRRHRAADAVAFCERLRRRRPGIVFGADLIAGFPTETDAMFENSLAHVADCGLTWLHVFPYSARPGTPAARMPQLPVALRRERAARLRAAGREASGRFLQSRVGRIADVLVESEGRGRSEHFAPVATPAELPAGSLRTLRITGSDGTTLAAGRA